MTLKIISRLFSILIVISFADTVFAQNESHYTLASLNMNDLSRPTAAPAWKKESRPISRGPQIDIRYPAVKTEDGGKIIEIQSPVRLDIVFVKGEAGGLVDMNSLVITGKKGWFKKTLTDRIKPYVDGNVINASGITVPSGRFLLQVSIADMAGVKTTEEYILVVK